MIAEMATSISDKMEFKIKKVTTNKEGHFIMIKCLINQEDKTIINIWT